MNSDELREAKERIINDPNTVEITYSKKMVDKFGSQSIIVKKEYVLGTECIELLYSYEGNTTNYKMVDVTVNYLINDVEITIIADVKHTTEPEYQEFIFTDDAVISPLNLGGYEGTEEEIQEAVIRRDLDRLHALRKRG